MLDNFVNKSKTISNTSEEQKLTEVQYGRCVECGSQVKQLIRKLQIDNYCLQTCEKCKNIADKYQEYENNLKFISLCLCMTSIYRHIFFNIKIIPGLFQKCIGITVFWLISVYWHEHVHINPNYDLPTHHKKIYDLVEEDQKEQNEMQYKNLMMLLTSNKEVLEIVSRQYVTFTLVMFTLTYTIKKIQGQKTPKDGNCLFMKVWWTVMLSQFGFFFVFVEVIWSYNQQFSNFLRIYGLYSNFMCLRGIINSRYESLIAILIVGTSFGVSLWFTGLPNKEESLEQLRNILQM